MALDRLALELEQRSHEDDDGGEGYDKTKGHVILDTTGQGGVQVVVHDWDAIHRDSEEEEEGFGDDDDEGAIRIGFGGRGISSVKATSMALGKTPRPAIEAEMM